MDDARRIAATCLLRRSRQLSRGVTRIYVERMRHLDLSVAQFTLLVAIGSAPGARAADLAPAIDLEKSTLSRELRGLVEAGLVREEALGGRSIGLTLTEAGAQRLADAVPAWEQAQAEAVRELGELGVALLDHFPPGS